MDSTADHALFSIKTLKYVENVPSGDPYFYAWGPKNSSNS